MDVLLLVKLQLTEPDALVCEITEYNNVSCNGGDDGQFTVTAKGGVGEYEFSIDGGESYQELGEFANLGAN